MKAAAFENYPWWKVAVCTALSLSIYAIGVYLVSSLGLGWVLVYAAYCVWAESRVLLGSCRRCYYFGKRCAFGKGRVCAWLFRKAPGAPLEAKQVTWRDLLPDFLVSLVPLVVGIGRLVAHFSWGDLALVLALVFLVSIGTGLVRGQLTCKFCKQREFGCPAERFFRQAKPA